MRQIEDSRFIIASLPRCGSTTLARLLNESQQVRCLIEPFHPARYEDQFHLAVSDVQTLNLTLDRIFSKWNGIKHVFRADGWPFLGCPGINESLITTPGLNVIFLVRRNLLRRVVSNCLSVMTGFWMGTREEFERRLDQTQLLPLSVDRVRRQIEMDRDANRRYLALLASSSATALTLHYEDIFDQHAGSTRQWRLVNDLLAFLQFSPVPYDEFEERWQRFFDTSTYCLSSPSVYSRIPGIEQIERAVGSDDTGWLFQESHKVCPSASTRIALDDT